MVPFCVICAILLLVFLIIINKTIEGMLTISEASHIAQVFLNDNLTANEKIEELKSKKESGIITDEIIINDLYTPDYPDNSTRLDYVYEDSLQTLYNERIDGNSVYSIRPETDRLNSKQFNQVVSYLFDDSLDEPTKILKIKQINNLNDAELLAILDNPSLSESVKLYGKEEGDDVIITTNTLINLMENPPQLPNRPSKNKKKKK